MIDNPVAVDIPIIDNNVPMEPPNPGHVAENEAIANLGDQVPAIAGNQEPTNAGDQASTSRSISSQIRDRKFLTQNYNRDSLIAAGGYSLGSDNKYPGRYRICTTF